MALPTLLAGTASTTSGAAVPDSSGTQFEVWLYSCSGLTSTYTRTLLTAYKGEVEEVAWRYDRVGGPDSAMVKLTGTVSSLDTAVQNEYEVEIRRADVVWYRGRITAYAHESDGAGNVKTLLTVEGYQTKLSERVFTKSYTSQTVKTIVQDILDTYVTPNTRITYAAANIVGAYTVNSISFVNSTVTDALRTLATLQGSTEWGICESSPPHAYFLAESSDSSENAYVLVQGKSPGLSTAGSLQTAWNQITVVGGYTDGAVVSGTGNDTTAQGTYGTRGKVVVEPSLLNASDCQRLGNNLATIYSNGLAYLTGTIQDPGARVEPDRTQAGGSYSGAGKATFWSGANRQSELWSRVSYAYRKGSPQNFVAVVEAGGPPDDVIQYVRSLDRRVSQLAALAQQTTELLDVGRVKARKNSAGSTFGPRSRINFIEGTNVTLTVTDDATNDEIDVTITVAGGASSHNMLSATHPDSDPTYAVSRGDVMVGIAGPLWGIRSLGASGTYFRSDGTDAAWSAIVQADIANAVAGASPAVGDLIYCAVAGSWAARSIGTAGQVLTVSGGVPAWADAGGASHNVLSATHSDSSAAAAARGAIIVGNSTPAWSRLTIGASATFLRSDGTDAAWTAIAAADLPATLTSNARVAVNKNSGATVGTRRRINFIEGTDVNITVADDSTNEEVDVTIGLPSTLTVNARVAVSRNSGATVGTRRRINFIEGTNITISVTDDPTNEEVDVTITAAGGGGSHNVLSATHSDSTAASATRGDIITAQGASPTWSRLAIGASGKYLRSDGTDPTWTAIADGDIPATLSANARVIVRRNSGTNVGTRRRINFIEGSNITLTVADDSTNEEVDVTIASSGSLDINGLTAADPALGDEVPIYDISASANRKITFEKIGFLTRFHMGGRLTGTSGTPVTTVDVDPIGTLYYTPYLDTVITLYDGTRWKAYTFSEISLEPTMTSGNNYDVFLYDNAGTLTLELSAAWTNDTTRADALTTQDGVYVKSGATTRRWIGTVRASQANGTMDTKLKRFLWNVYNQVPRYLSVADTTDSWTYNGSGTTWRQSNGAATNQVEYVTGQAETLVKATAYGAAQESTLLYATGIGVDSTTVNSSQIQHGEKIDGVAGFTMVTSMYKEYPGLGYHYLAWLEITSANLTIYGDNGGVYMQTGLQAEIMA